MKRLFWVVAVVAAVVAALYLVPSDHYVFLPDRARPVDGLVRIEGESRDGKGEAMGQAAAEDEEGIYMVDILVRRASLLQRLLPELSPNATLMPPEVVNPIGVPEEQRRRTSLNQMSRSQEVAVTVALRALGYEVGVRDEGAEVTTVVPDRPADGVLEVGDVIVRANGEAVRSPAALQQAMAELEPGDEVDLVLLRDDERVRLRVGTTTAEDDRGRAVFGVLVQQAATFEFPLEIEIDAGDIGGPSAGLAFALGITDSLGDDVTCGRQVTVTGELALDGSVQAIGGVKQKAIGAADSGADVFVVPTANAEEARRHANDDLEVVPVASYRQAVGALAC